MATNNKLILTFNRDFTLDDTVELVIQISQVGGVTTFTWVNTVSNAFEVEIGTPTGILGENTAINFTAAWQNSITGYSISQSTNSVTIVAGDNTSFISVVAKDSGGNTYNIPADYNVAILTQSSGNKITYSDKIGLRPKKTHINQWWDDDANEVKEKHNLNDDRITQNELLKANLNGGNIFTGNQQFNNGVVTTDTDMVINGIRVGGGNSAVNTNVIMGNGAAANILPDEVTACVIIGTQAAENITDLDKITVVGHFSGKNLTTGGFSTFYGYESGRDNEDGLDNTWGGYASGQINISGNFNTGWGYAVARFLQGGSENVMYGWGAGRGVSEVNPYTGSSSMFMGYQTGQKALQALRDTFVGYQSGFAANGSEDNTTLGYFSGQGIITNVRCTYLGSRAALNATQSQRMTAIGYDTASGITTGGNNSLYIGANIQPSSATVNAEMRIGLGNGTVLIDWLASKFILDSTFSILKNGDGSTTLSNENDEKINVDATVRIEGATSAVLEMYDQGEAVSGTMTYDGNAEEFTFSTEVDVEGIASARALKTTGYTVATLPTGSQGMRAYVTDASSVSYRATATGGGSEVVSVFHDGTNWIYS